MHKPESPLPDGTKIFVHNKPLGSTEKMKGIGSQNLASRRPNSEGVAWGSIKPLNNDIYWIKHGDDKVLAAYGYWEFELVTEETK